MRPKSGKFDLRPEEMDGLSYYVLSGCPREVAFLKFMRPDFIGSKASAAVKSAVTQFFSAKPAKDYLEAYKQTIEDLLSPKQAKAEPVGNIEERKARAKTKLVEFAMSLADHIEDAEDPETVLKLADKVGLLDQDEEVEVAPQRFLSERCCDCRYRLFCEENTEDECKYCKYRKFGEENGIYYDHKTQLDISGTELEATTDNE